MVIWEPVDEERPVVVVGACGVDVIAAPKHLPALGERSPSGMRLDFGGVGHNVAANLALLGQPVRIISVLGRDVWGDLVQQHLEALGIDTQGVLRTDEATGVYVGVLHPQGGIAYSLYAEGALNALTPEHLRQHEGLFQDAAAVFVDANVPRRTLRTLFALARRYRLPVVADPATPALAARLRPYLARLAVVTPNHREAAALVGYDLPQDDFSVLLQAARALVAQGVDLAIITLAEFGVCYATSEASGHIPALKTALVDPTGAGDALTAAVMYALLHGIPVDDAVRLGIAAAALTLASPGTVAMDLSLERLYDQLIL